MSTAKADRDGRLDRLFDLLPMVHRRRDGETGDRLRALLEVASEQLAFVEDDIDQRYEDWFIETCADWAIPYIGALVGVAPATSGLVPSRRTVANAVRERRRKGVASVLAALARDIGDWPAYPAEFGRLLGQTQSLRLGRPGRGLTIDVRRRGDCGPFDTRGYTADTRRTAEREGGRYLNGNVGLFLWRLRAYPVTRAPAACVEDIGPNFYTFSLLGNDSPLFNRPRAGGGDVSGPLDAPVRIDRALLAAPRRPGRRFATASSDYYGLAERGKEVVAQSIALWVRGWPTAKESGQTPVPADKVIIADLEDWSYAPPPDHIAIDPVRGRIAFPTRKFPRRQAGVTVSYHYGFTADIGGGEYRRPLAQHRDAKVEVVRGVQALGEALRPWEPELDDDGNLSAPKDQPEHQVIEIADSGLYELRVNVMLAPGHSLQIRAAQRTRPVLRLQDSRADAPDSLAIAGGEDSRFVLDGLVVAGRGVTIEGQIASVTLRHCTLVPGWSLDPHCDPRRPAEPSIELIDTGACLVVRKSIVGSIQVNADEVRTEPARLLVEDSILDATGADCDSPQCEAVGAEGSRYAFALARFARSTVIGRVLVHAVEAAENSIFLGRVRVARRQVGWMRFCHVAPESRTPRRFRCQPDLAEAAARKADQDAPDAAAARARAAVWPRFDSLRYGHPEYARLAADCPREISAGADDGGEMGVFHHVDATRRLDALATALEDHAPIGTSIGTILAD
jgi:hypothetical protein